MRLRDALSPCRIDPSKGAHRHPCSRQHAQLVEDYRLARAVWEQHREAACLDYTAERTEWEQQHPAPTWRTWLQHTRRED